MEQQKLEQVLESKLKKREDGSFVFGCGEKIDYYDKEGPQKMFEYTVAITNQTITVSEVVNTQPFHEKDLDFKELSLSEITSKVIPLLDSMLDKLFEIRDNQLLVLN